MAKIPFKPDLRYANGHNNQHTTYQLITQYISITDRHPYTQHNEINLARLKMGSP